MSEVAAFLTNEIIDGKVTGPFLKLESHSIEQSSLPGRDVTLSEKANTSATSELLHLLRTSIGRVAFSFVERTHLNRTCLAALVVLALLVVGS